MRAPREPWEWERDKERTTTDPAKRRLYAGIPEHLRRMTWTDYKTTAITDGGERLYDILVDYADHWTPATREGIVLLGPAGWGKTLGACLVAMQVLDKGGWVKYTTYRNLLDRRKAVFSLQQSDDESDQWDAVLAVRRLEVIEQLCDLLVLDDVGKEYRAASGWSDAELDALLRKRQEAGKATIITSNLSVKDWRGYNSSMASFIYEVGEVVELTEGKDHRLRLTEAQKRRRAGR